MRGWGHAASLERALPFLFGGPRERAGFGGVERQQNDQRRVHRRGAGLAGGCLRERDAGRRRAPAGQEEQNRGERHARLALRAGRACRREPTGRRAFEPSRGSHEPASGGSTRTTAGPPCCDGKPARAAGDTARVPTGGGGGAGVRRVRRAGALLPSPQYSSAFPNSNPYGQPQTVPAHQTASPYPSVPRDGANDGWFEDARTSAAPVGHPPVGHPSYAQPNGYAYGRPPPPSGNDDGWF